MKLSITIYQGPEHDYRVKKHGAVVTVKKYAGIYDIVVNSGYPALTASTLISHEIKSILQQEELK